MNYSYLPDAFFLAGEGFIFAGMLLIIVAVLIRIAS